MSASVVNLDSERVSLSPVRNLLASLKDMITEILSPRLQKQPVGDAADYGDACPASPASTEESFNFASGLNGLIQYHPGPPKFLDSYASEPKVEDRVPSVSFRGWEEDHWPDNACYFMDSVVKPILLPIAERE